MTDPEDSRPPGRFRASTSGWRGLSVAAIRAASAMRLDRESSEEVAQDAMLTLARLPYTPRSPIAWLRMAIRRLVWRRFERSRLERKAQAEFLDEAPVQHEVHPEVAISLDEISDQLPDRSRRILALVRKGLTHREIAEELGCKVQQVGPRIARALEVARRHSR